MMKLLLLLQAVLAAVATSPLKLQPTQNQRPSTRLERLDHFQHKFTAFHVQHLTDASYEDKTEEEYLQLWKNYEEIGQKLSSSREPSPEDVVFELFTRTSSFVYERLRSTDFNGLKNSSFDSTKDTVVLIHGFLEDADLAPWMQTLKRFFLEKKEQNVIIVQWAQLADVSNYYAAARDVSFVGVELGKLLSALKRAAGLSEKRTHLIGFSLGAHVAGIAGQHFPGISRISGLDPAGPYFSRRDIDERLDHTDAKFVDVIHTNYGGLLKLHFGYEDALGHVDFYVNGGSLQPGCPPIVKEAIEMFLSGDIRDFSSCNHDRSYIYYIEAARKSLVYTTLGFQCPDYQNFTMGECLRNHTNTLGLQASPTKPGVYYLDTQDSAPYLSREVEVHIIIGTVNHTTVGELKLTNYPLDRHSETLELASLYHRYKSGEHLLGMLTVPQESSILDLPLQLRFQRNLWDILGNNKLEVEELRLTEVQYHRSYFACNLQLESRKWTTATLSRRRCPATSIFQ
uniref:Phospholipase A1 member A-like n=1 Tax=Hirondellea gigas TaxID=1518452 RepID=A0A2P2HZE4_9CRUS